MPLSMATTPIRISRCFSLCGTGLQHLFSSWRQACSMSKSAFHLCTSAQPSRLGSVDVQHQYMSVAQPMFRSLSRLLAAGKRRR